MYRNNTITEWRIIVTLWTSAYIIYPQWFSCTLCDNAQSNKAKEQKTHTNTHLAEAKRKDKETATANGNNSSKRLSKNRIHTSSSEPEYSNGQKTPIWDFSKVSLCAVAIDFSRSTVDANVRSIGQFAYTSEREPLHGWAQHNRQATSTKLQ